MSSSRREFLKAIPVTGLSLSALVPRESLGISAVPARTIEEIFKNGIVIDDLSGFAPDPSLPDDGFQAIRDSGVTIVGPTLGDVVPDRSYETSIREIAKQGRTIAQYRDRMMLIRNFSDIARARQEDKLGILINFQNSTAIGTDLDNLDLFFDLGVRQIQITFNWRNWVGDGCTERTQAGLSYFGVDLVKKMNQLGMIVDVGHTGYQSTLDAVEVSDGPIVFSHTNCKAVCDHPRNKTDDQIKALARKGGVMGMTTFNWFVSDKPRSTLEDLLDHFDHAMKLVGPDHIGIGSDFELPGWAATEPDAEWERHASLYGERERKTLRLRFPPFIAEVNDEKRYWTIARGLEKRGYKTADIEKILGLNFVRIYKQILNP